MVIRIGGLSTTCAQLHLFLLLKAREVCRREIEETEGKDIENGDFKSKSMDYVRYVGHLTHSCTLLHPKKI